MAFGDNAKARRAARREYLSELWATYQAGRTERQGARQAGMTARTQSRQWGKTYRKELGQTGKTDRREMKEMGKLAGSGGLMPGFDSALQAGEVLNLYTDSSSNGASSIMDNEYFWPVVIGGAVVFFMSRGKK